jgi:hypothetical protein
MKSCIPDTEPGARPKPQGKTQDDAARQVRVSTVSSPSMDHVAIREAACAIARRLIHGRWRTLAPHDLRHGEVAQMAESCMSRIEPSIEVGGRALAVGW